MDNCTESRIANIQMKIIEIGINYLYATIQEKIGHDFLKRKAWAKKSLLNIARSGIFSIDRTVKEYAQDIWHVSSTLQRKK